MVFDGHAHEGMAVDGNLDDEREPGLDADVDEAEVGMEEVIIEAETFSVRGDDAWAADGIGDFERGTSFQLGKDADEAAGDVEIYGDTPGFVLLADVPREALVRTFVMSGNGADEPESPPSFSNEIRTAINNDRR